MADWTIRILTTPDEMSAVEKLQREVWPGSETDIVPAHVLLTAAHNGGLVLGAYLRSELVGMVFGFPGLEKVPDGPRPKHCSHMLGVRPDIRDSGLGFALKRAQWQIIRHQGLDHITWTYDPLLSRNAYLNIARLGAVCNNYLQSVYGEMRDGLNIGLPSDRFQVDWWINTRRVKQRLSRRARTTFELDHFEKAAVQFLYQTEINADGWPSAPQKFLPPSERMIVTEIPTDFLALKKADKSLAQAWRFFTREVFESSFSQGYLVTDFIYDRTAQTPRSFYVLIHGESTMDDGDFILLD